MSTFLFRARNPLLLFCVAVVVSAVSAREIALTFDDAPRADQAFQTGDERGRMLVEALSRVAVEQVMFLVTTGHINKQSRERLLHYQQAGHLLGNHSHTHQHPDRMGVDEYLADIRHAQSILDEFPGVEKFYRYPFLDEGHDETSRNALREGLATLGLNNAYVTIDNYDWYMDHLLQRAVAAGRTINFKLLGQIYVEQMLGSVAFYDRIAQESLGYSPRHVLLLHENDLAALFIDDLVLALRERGWRIISPLVAYEDPIAGQVPGTLFNGQGRVAALARAKGRTAGELVHPNEDEDYLRRLFNEAGIFGPVAD